MTFDETEQFCKNGGSDRMLLREVVTLKTDRNDVKLCFHVEEDDFLCEVC